MTAAWHELYDLENDPSESNNLAADNKATLRSMLKTMAGELEAKTAQYPEEKWTSPNVPTPQDWVLVMAKATTKQHSESKD